MIDNFGFGWIVIDGRKYTSDLIIYPDGSIVDSWRRMSGHRLSWVDISELIENKPDVIIAGTGVHGLVRPEKELESMLSKKGMAFMAMSNQKAVEHFNELSLKKRIGACFHLTC